MKAPVGLLSDRTVLRSKMEGPRPDKFAFAQRSGAMKGRRCFFVRFHIKNTLQPYAGYFLHILFSLV